MMPVSIVAELWLDLPFPAAHAAQRTTRMATGDSGVEPIKTLTTRRDSGRSAFPVPPSACRSFHMRDHDRWPRRSGLTLLLAGLFCVSLGTQAVAQNPVCSRCQRPLPRLAGPLAGSTLAPRLTPIPDSRPTLRTQETPVPNTWIAEPQVVETPLYRPRTVWRPVMYWPSLRWECVGVQRAHTYWRR